MFTYITYGYLILGVVFGLPFYILPELCQTEECYQLGNTVSESLDTTFSPCSNFYKFSCNGWITKSKKPQHTIYWSHWQDVELKIIKRVQKILQESDDENLAKLKRVYKSCTTRYLSDNVHLEELKLVVERLGGWPASTKSWDGKKYNWLYKISEVTSLLDIHPIFRMRINIDIYNKSNTVFYISEGDTILPISILMNPDIYDKEIHTYTKWMYQTLKHIYKSNVASDVRKQIWEMVQFEIKLARIMSLSHGTSIKTTLQFVKSKEKVNFLHPLQNLFQHSSINVSQTDKVIINDKYLRYVLQLIEKTKTHVIANYISWHAVKEVSRDTTKYMRSLNFMMDKIVFGVNIDTDLRDECTKMIMDHLGFAIMPVYSKTYIDSTIISEVNEMIANIQKQFAMMLRNNLWLNNKTKEAVTEKILTMNMQVGFPDWISNNSLLKKYYEKLEVSENHFLNVLKIKSFSRQKVLERITVSEDKIGWWLKPFEINAGYSVLKNAMRRRANKYGELVNWWTETDVSIYRDRIECFKKQYEHFGANGHETIGENIADNVGLNISWAAFKNLGKSKVRPVIPKLEFYMDDQLFFISYAQIWCEVPTNNPLLEVASYAAEEVRVLASINNNFDFQKSFNCKKQNEKSCILW